MRSEVLRVRPELQELCRQLVDRSVRARVFSTWEIWTAIWELPFFSAMRRDIASRRIAATARLGVFDSYHHLRGAATDPIHAWHVARQDGVYVAQGAKAQAYCSGSGEFAEMGIRTNPFVVQRLSRLADLLGAVEDEIGSDACFFEHVAGGENNPDLIWPKGFDLLAPAIGNVTALHALTDLGFPTVKPDIWISRLSAYHRWTVGFLPKQLETSRRGWLVLFRFAREIANRAAEKIPSANPLREFDFYVANYGMIFQPDIPH
jgi:hypothetical protein